MRSYRHNHKNYWQYKVSLELSCLAPPLPGSTASVGVQGTGGPHPRADTRAVKRLPTTVHANKIWRKDNKTTGRPAGCIASTQASRPTDKRTRAFSSSHLAHAFSALERERFRHHADRQRVLRANKTRDNATMIKPRQVLGVLEVYFEILSSTLYLVPSIVFGRTHG